jgi:hypothetical protein
MVVMVMVAVHILVGESIQIGIVDLLEFDENIRIANENINT